MKFPQFLHLGGYGREPRAGAPAWSRIECITAEGARVPSASRHVKYKSSPVVLYGGNPIEAGRLAIERAMMARDAQGRRLRRDGVALLAGVVSYPVPKDCLAEPAEGDIYNLWRCEVTDWLIDQFGPRLQSVVEHDDEQYLHLHFYVLPERLTDGRLDLHYIHPGRSFKVAAAEAGASKKDQDAAYRRGMERWQDDFWYCVSRKFGHTRFGPKRERVSRRERQIQKRLEAEQARRIDELALERAEMEHAARNRSADLSRQLKELHRQLAVMAELHTLERARRIKAESVTETLRGQLHDQDSTSNLAF